MAADTLTVVGVGPILAPAVVLLHVVTHDEAVHVVVVLLLLGRVVLAVPAAARASRPAPLPDDLVDTRGGASHGGGQGRILVRVGGGLGVG
jgi:hypothetical protein